ncbi:hypothetical protein BC936DRAFT_150146 [Jimgerdemannia flammicorona]|uniref:Secreted protein n=1 Tax=Jimgerdemannia flammicorona TaxID=994334 RepID=A0A433CZC9_9FUNG|nr:hypothetical protein BC936DRAFT_150146 [Jimgerdemannia flammicorona]
MRLVLFVVVVVVILVVGNVEVLELEGVLIRGDDTEPVTELVLLQELLGEVFEVALGESRVGSNGDLGVVAAGNGDGIAEVVGTTTDLDAIVEELLLRMSR